MALGEASTIITSLEISSQYNSGVVNQGFKYWPVNPIKKFKLKYYTTPIS